MSKNILTVMFLGISLVHGLPRSLEQEVERATCAVIHLPPAPVPPEQLLAAQTTIENCIESLRKYLKREGYDREVQNRILILRSDLRFLKGCRDILLGEESFDSPNAQRWADSSSGYESYLRHFRRR